ncbi:MAG: glycosyltransferase family A protein [Patescibacteria group bacterium]
MKKEKQEQVFFYILIRSWRAFPYLYRCIESAVSQNYPQYKILFIDDASDYHRSEKDYIRKALRDHIAVFNKQRKHAVRNAFEIINQHVINSQAVVVNLDGDDWFIDSNVLNYLAKIYQNEQCWFTYGNCKIWNQSLQAINTIDIYANLPYSRKIMTNRTYRCEPFHCSHLRTWKTWLYKKIRKEDFLRPDGSWLQYAEDQAIFYPMLEMGGDHGVAIKKPLSIYNVNSQNNDVKCAPLLLIRDELIIRKKKTYVPLA